MNRRACFELIGSSLGIVRIQQQPGRKRSQVGIPPFVKSQLCEACGRAEMPGSGEAGRIRDTSFPAGSPGHEIGIGGGTRCLRLFVIEAGVWGAQNSVQPLTTCVAFRALRSFVYFILVRLVGVFTGRGSVSQLQLENAVLRHQLRVLRRTVRRPDLKDRDRAFLAAASRALSRDRWASFMVTPRRCFDGTGRS
jgi:hypothetical protein